MTADAHDLARRQAEMLLARARQDTPGRRTAGRSRRGVLAVLAAPLARLVAVDAPTDLDYVLAEVRHGATPGVREWGRLAPAGRWRLASQVVSTRRELVAAAQRAARA